jgi:hypothetical protein
MTNKFDATQGPVIPAQPGYFACNVHEDEYVSRLPVIGWRIIAGNEAIPLVPGDHFDFDLIECPDGRVIQPYHADHDSMDGAVAEVMRLRAEAV